MTSTTAPSRSGPSALVTIFRLPILLFLLLSVGATAIGLELFRSEQVSVRRSTEDELAVVAHLKAQALERWIDERRGDAQALARQIEIAGVAESWLASGAPADDRRRTLAAQVATLSVYRQYRAIALTDASGRALIWSAGQRRALEPPARECARRTLEVKQVVLADDPDAALWRQGSGVYLCAPVRSTTTKRAIGAVVLAVDPTAALLPLIDWWPGARSSATTTMVEAIGQRFVRLNRPAANGEERRPAGLPLDLGTPSAIAARRTESVFEGRDGRGVKIIAATMPVENSNWALSVKIDQAEAFASIRRLAVVLACAGAWLAGAIVLLLISVWRRQQAVALARELQVESERRKLASQFEILSKYAHDIILLADAAGTILEANDQALSAYGLPRERLIGLNLQALAAADGSAATTPGADGSQGLTYETRQQRADGSTFPVEVSERRLIFEGRPRRQLIIRDITDRKAAEKRAAAAAAILSAQSELSPDGILVVDENDRWASYNRRFVDMWGIPEEVVRTGSDTAAREAVQSKLTDPQAFAERVTYLNAHREESSHEEITLVDGRVFERHSAPMSLGEDQISGRVWYFRDITGIRRAEAEQARLAAIVESSADAIYSVDPDGIVTSWNAGAESLYGFPAAEIVGRSIRITCPPDRLDEVDRALASLRRPDRYPAYETVRLRKNGEPLDVAVTLSAIRAPDGAVIGGSAIVRDIRERKRQERVLARTTRALQTLSQGNLTLVRATSVEGLYRAMCEVIVETGGFRMAWIGLADDDVQKSVRPAASAGHEAGYLAQANVSWADNERGRGPTGSCVREGRTSVIRWADRDPQMRPWRDEALKRGYRSSIALPLRDEARVFGALTIYAGEPDAFGLEETRLLEELASDISFGVGVLKARQTRDSLAAIVESSRDAIIGKTLDGTITSWNQAAAEMYGYSADEAVGQSINLIIPRDRQEEFDWILQKVRQGESTELFETVRVRKDGRSLAVALVVSPTRDLNGAVVGASAIARDITEQKRIERDLVRAARIDSLTGLPNRGTFVDALNRAIADGRRWKRSFAVLFLDLDHFKDVNDTLGHPAGDELLKAVAQRLRETVRDTDTVARFGGDEFAVIGQDVKDPAGVGIFAQRLLDAVSAPMRVGDVEVRSGTSIGIAVFDPDIPDAETLLSYADIALYRAKAEGRGTFRFFTDAMDAEVRRRVTLGGELRTAIETGQLFLLYQPQVDAKSGRIIGLEALVRWRHASRGVVGPGEFIPVAEQIGLAVPLGRWVIDAACRQIRAWLDDGLTPPPVGVNLSAIHFRAPGELERDLRNSLDAYRLEPDRLELELTETVLMEASLEHGETLGRLRAMGFGLSIDDFGTGYSSLDYLRRFPVNRIKIDQGFVRDIGGAEGSEAIIRATIGLGQAMGLQVIAEGVETVEQFDRLKTWGCPQMQGFHFARPLAADRVAELLKDGGPLPSPTA